MVCPSSRAHRTLTVPLNRALPHPPPDCVVASAVVELKSLVQSQMPGASHAGPSSAPLTIVERLAYRIDEIRHAQARACIVWLVGQYAADDSPNAVIEGVAPWAPDVLRKIAKSLRDEVRCHHPFADQSSSAKKNPFFFSAFSILPKRPYP
jgi:hypothetical protein